MTDASIPKIHKAISLIMLISLFVFSPVKAQSQDSRPVAEAGLSRYVATDPVQLDGTGSYDPDDSGIVLYSWQQISGPTVAISDANTATPTISGFVQTDEIQECEFELVVWDGELTSLPDSVKIVIVPTFGESQLQLYNEAFNPNKPTILYFGGGDCIVGGTNPNYDLRLPFRSSEWKNKANIIWFPDGYGPDPDSEERSYYKYGDMLIVYLSGVAPDYKQQIQTTGWSTGGQPAIDVGILLNLTYKDPRYAVNHVTILDGAQYCRDNTTCIQTYLGSSVEGEQCWVDSYIGSINENHMATPGPSFPLFHNNVLNIAFDKYESRSVGWMQQHFLVNDSYGDSLSNPAALQFNSGIVGGAYWSVIGPGKNLQLALTTDEVIYKFKWYGIGSSGHMDFYDEPNHPGRLPEPVTLVGPENGSFVDVNGAIFSCQESENAIGYQLLFGPDPYHVMDYYIFSDTPSPPTEVITSSPFKPTWWTVRVYDQYGSTIYDDPIKVNFENLAPPLIENITTGQRYGSVRHAVNDARSGHEIVVSPGLYKGNINFKGKNITVRSTNPTDPTIMATTIIIGDGNNNLVTFSGGEDANCILTGFTITDANNGIYCYGASPRIANCIIVSNVSSGIALYMGSNPTVTNCFVANNGYTGIEMRLQKIGRTTIYNRPMITNCTIVGNHQHGISGGIPTITNSIIWINSSQQIADTYGSVTYSDIQGGWSGEGNINADPLFADPENGDYHLESQAGRFNPNTQTWVVDDITSTCVDAGDPSSPIGLEPVPNGGRINMGAYGGTSEASKSP